MRELEYRPVTVLPYIFGGMWLIAGLALAAVYVLQRKTTPDLALAAMAIGFMGIAFVCIVPRLAGFPRIRVLGSTVSLERYFGGTTRFDTESLGNAFAFPARHGMYLGFPDAGEEQALRMRGHGELVDQFSAKRSIPITAIVGLNMRNAEQLARTINAARPAGSHVAMTHQEVTQINRRAVRLRRTVWVVCVVLVAVLILLAWIGVL